MNQVAFKKGLTESMFIDLNGDQKV